MLYLVLSGPVLATSMQTSHREYGHVENRTRMRTTSSGEFGCEAAVHSSSSRQARAGQVGGWMGAFGARGVATCFFCSRARKASCWLAVSSDGIFGAMTRSRNSLYVRLWEWVWNGRIANHRHMRVASSRQTRYQRTGAVGLGSFRHDVLGVEHFSKIAQHIMMAPSWCSRPHLQQHGDLKRASAVCSTKWKWNPLKEQGKLAAHFVDF